jgi:hypothetical protein
MEGNMCMASLQQAPTSRHETGLNKKSVAHLEIRTGFTISREKGKKNRLRSLKRLVHIKIFTLHKPEVMAVKSVEGNML